MLIAPDSVIAARRRLFQQMEAGTLTYEQAFQQALELDPNDWVALAGLSAVRRESGDLEEAERLCWRGLRAHPCVSESYVFLAGLVARHKKSSSLAEGLMELGLRKVLRDEEALSEFLESGRETKTRADVEATVAALATLRTSQPQRAADVLRPYRLIHELQVAPAGRLDRKLVDLIVEPGAECGLLLIGVLRDWIEERLPEGEDFPAEASLALLGEIGDPATLPELLEFSTLEDEVLSGAAHWSVARIAGRRPAETLQAFQRIAAETDLIAMGAVAQYLALVPPMEGAVELLLGMIERLGSLRKAERDGLFVCVATALLGVERERGPAIVKAAFDRHSRELTQKGRARCYQLLKAWDSHPHRNIEPDERDVYDFCCWREREEPEEPRPEKPSPGRKLDSVEVALRGKLAAFPEEALRKRDIDHAVALFFGESLGAPPDDADRAPFIEWLIYDYVAPRLGRTLIEEFLARNRRQLTARECELLERWSRSRYSLFEVQRVEPEKGIEIKDLLTGEVVFAHDVSASRQAARWDCVLFRVEEADDGMELSGVGISVPRPQSAPLREWILADQKSSGLPWSRYLRANSHRLRGKALELGERAIRSLKVVSAEGDPLVFSKAIYKVLDEAALTRALESSEVLDRRDPSEGWFDWFETPAKPDGSRRVLGALRVEGGRLVLEANSRERLGRGRELVERLAGAAVSHQGDEFTGLEAAMRKPKRTGPKPESGIPPEVERELIQKVMAEHYRTWPDTPLPALGGKTPRQAVATAEGRAQVADLLKLFENGEERNRREGRAWFDVSGLKAELQIEF
jgi:Protein of unknown function (DUF2384)